MDLGIYCLYPAIILFGVPDKVDAHARFLDTGADASGCVTLQYADKTVVLTYSKTAQGVIGSEIQGRTVSSNPAHLQAGRYDLHSAQWGGTSADQTGGKNTGRCPTRWLSLNALLRSQTAIDHTISMSAIWR